ncbi:MAG TPA: HlyD family efflux transporter periplasmic adaptor subunit [Tepidisphaeraceae bacterium]|jgi:multidrug efflux pump subunit AcrA (membrane-fusion protein)
MTQLAVSKPSKASSRPIPGWVIALAAFATILVVGAFVLYFAKPFSSTAANEGLKTVPVKQGPFEIRVNVKGDLQAVDNIDIVCLVEGQTTITQIVAEGASVKKGDTLVVLDSSAIRQKLEDSLIDVQRVTADVTNAQEMVEIQESSNAAAIEAAEVALQLAQIDMIKYNEGEYPSALADANMAFEKAQTALKTKQDDLAQSRSLFAKGFVTATEVKTRDLDVIAARRDLTKAETDKKVLEQYTHQADSATKKNALAQAEQKLERTKRENAANLSQKTADLRAKQQQFDVISRRSQRLKEQVAACIITAPADGLVVYQNTGDRDRAQIQEGAIVRERQTLMRLPDTSRMKVVLKANENQVGLLQAKQQATVKLPSMNRQFTASVVKIGAVPDSTNRWMNPDAKDYPVDVLLDETPAGLRPGMTAEVSILIERIEDAVTIPLAALFSAGQDRYAFTPTGETVTPLKLEISKANDQDVMVMRGVETDQPVVLLEPGQGKVFLERAGIKTAEPAAPLPGEKSNRPRREGQGASQGGSGQGGSNGTAPAPVAVPALPASTQPQ